MFSRFRKLSLGATLAIFLFVGMAGVFVPEPKPAQAIPVEITANITAAALEIKRIITEVLKAALINAGVKAASYALRKVAQDSAVWIASGGKGQKPLAFGKGFEDYLKNVGSEAGGAAIEEFSKGTGFNICKPPDIKVDLSLKVGMRNKFVTGGPPKKPACDTATFLKNWQTGLSKFSKPGELTKMFNVSLQADDSDFGIYGAATAKIGEKVATIREAKTLDREEGKGFKPPVTPVSGDLKTPAALVEESAKSQTPDKKVQSDEDQLNAAIASGDAKVFPTILSIFLSTLGSNVISNFQTKGILPFGLCVGGLGGDSCKGEIGSIDPDGLLNPEGAGFAGFGRAAARAAFSYLTAVKIKEPTRYDLISQLNSCPDAPSIYNCRAGDDLVNAIEQNMTIGEAIKTGVLDGAKKLISPEDVKNKNIKCYLDAYCLNNIRVLRQVSILPVGFELAVEKSPPGASWSLQDVVKGFFDCGSNLTTYDPAHPFCHLIDPNWVLKVPLARCNALVNGASLAGDSVPNRLEECADLQTCVNMNIDGSCAEYAYCTRTKNTWKFPADSCRGEFASCRSFQNSAGQTVSYLMNTVEKSFCTQENVGCRAFSLTAGANGWKDPKFDPLLGANNGIYFNNNAETGCPASAVGCSAFQVASSTSVQLALRRAPDYLGCYDSVPATPAVDWPTDAVSLSAISANPECSKYAAVCAAEENGCNWYAPVSGGGTRLPAKFEPAEIVNNQLDWNDQCDAKCVGYNAYREMPTSYSNGEALAYIIPSSGTTCTVQNEGCTSFTNLSTSTGRSEQIEYFTALRNCLKPSETSDGRGKTYITYEGSASAGFQLKTYSLLRNEVTDANGPANAPKYFFKDPAELAALNAECTEQRYKDGVASLDCRQFNDEAGNFYYRTLSHTIPVTNDCTPYRINEPAFYTDSSVATQDACLTQYGFWDMSVSASGVCRMCLSGGQYRGGLCIYNGLSGGVANNAGTSRSCSAAADTCRAYKGNAGNNIQNIFYDTFENPDDINNWGAKSIASRKVIVPVSTHVGENSLQIYGLDEEGPSPYGAARTTTFEIGKSYDLTFWAASDANMIATVSIIPNDSSSPITFGTSNVIAGTWQQYHLGPVEYLANTTTARLDFTLSIPNQSLYLDNIRLTKVADFIYLNKKSLSVDPVCDSLPDDGLPGEALGCAAYTNPQGNKFNLRNFSFLCREGAIGCTGLFDTRNTASPLADTYNVWFAGATGATSPVIGGSSNTCVVPAGQSGCYVNIIGHSIYEIVTNGSMTAVNSTVVVASDTPANSPIYLVADQKASCSQADLGCTYAGLQSYNSLGVKVYTTTTIKNDPSQYGNTLCQAEAVGCSAFNDGAEVNYFKDPDIGGQKFCEYRTGVKANGAGSPTDGWFQRNPIGHCSNNGATLCTTDSVFTDCGSSATCIATENVPCDSVPFYVTDSDNLRVKLSTFSGNLRTFPGTSIGISSLYGVAIDSSGNLYVTGDSTRIGKLDQATGLWTVTGTPGNGLGQFNGITGIATDLSGNLYVSDSGNDRVQKLNVSTGAWSAYMAFGYLDANGNSIPGLFANPKGLTLDSSNNLYVADDGNNRIQKLNVSTGVWTSYGSFGSGLGQFSSPSDVDVDSVGNIYVADFDNYRIQKLEIASGVWTSYGSFGSGVGQFSGPMGVDVDSKGNIFVTDYSNHRIQRLDIASGRWSSYGSSGDGADQFGFPRNISIDSNYINPISLCPTDQNRCTAFIDHADLDKKNQPKSYYLIKDDKVTEGDCSDQVSQKAGCALFDEVDNPSKLWNTVTTYTDSNSKDGALVVPTSDSATNDANIIMKVIQDRECGQWLKPLGSFSTYDDQRQAYKEITWGNLSVCDRKKCAISSASSILTADIYRQRATGWYDLDYAGYSIPGIRPLEYLEQRNISTAEVKDWRLVYRKPNCSTSGNTCYELPDGSPVVGSVEGRQICRAYPEVDSPFPNTDAILKNATFFRNAHICDEGSGGSDKCDCDYRKVQYGDVFTKYWQTKSKGSTDRNTILASSMTTKPNVPPDGICLGGILTTGTGTSLTKTPMDGKQCLDDTNCGDGGTCQLMKSSHSFVGLRGFCLEQDDTRHINSNQAQNACLTWYPIESLAGATDISNLQTDALRDWQDPKLGGGRYCLNSSAPAVWGTSAAAPGTDISFELAFSPIGIKNYPVTAQNPTGYAPVDQGFGPPQFKLTAKTTGGIPSFDYWGAHSKVGKYAGVFKICDQSGPSGVCTNFDNLNNVADMSSVSIDDIEEIVVEVLNSDGLYHNIAYPPSTKFSFPNLKNKSDLQPYYHVGTTMPPNETQKGAVAGGFYKDSDGFSHFIMLYSGYDELPTVEPGGTSIDSITQEVSSKWFYTTGKFVGRTEIGLKGNMKTNSSYPVLFDKTGTKSLWGVRNNEITDACPYIDPGTFVDFNFYEMPVLWHAMKIDFTPSFTGIDTFFCGRSIFANTVDMNGGKDKIVYKITYKLRQICSVITDAEVDFNNNSFSDPNRTVPWTNRLWNLTKNANSYTNSFTVPGVGYTYDTLIKPFGTLGVSSLSDPAVASKLVTLTPYTPSPCAPNGVATCPADPDKAAAYEGPNIAPGAINTYSYPRTGAALQVGVDRLSMLFANVSGNYSWISSAARYNLTPGSGLTDTTRTSPNPANPAPQPPKIHMLAAPAVDVINNAGEYLEGGSDGFSIIYNNRVYNGGDYTNDTVRSSQNQNTLSLSAAFFMSADANQMPLRKVIIDWDDGKQPVEIEGYFRNKRGLLGGLPQTRACKIVAEASDYGHIKDVTCDNGYFKINNTYSCSDDSPRFKIPSLCDLNYPSAYPKGCCIFRPRVQVKDNWGWCNGSCAGSTSGPNGGCYDAKRFVNGAPLGDDGCDIGNAPNLNPSPWTPFGGALSTGEVVVANLE